MPTNSQIINYTQLNEEVGNGVYELKGPIPLSTQQVVDYSALKNWINMDEAQLITDNQSDTECPDYEETQIYAIAPSGGGGQYTNVEQHNFAIDTLPVNAFFGKSVDVSNDGSVAVTCHANASIDGAIYIYEKSGATWSLFQTINLGSELCMSIRISGDGLTLAKTSDNDGNVRLYRRASTGVNFTEISGGINLVSYPKGSGFGYSIDITNDGNRIIVGDPSNPRGLYNTGGMYIFDYNSGTDSYDETVSLDIGGSSGFNTQYGAHVYISPDGSTAVVSSLKEGTYVYRNTGSWVPLQQVGNVNATSVGISADGSTIVVNGGAYVWKETTTNVWVIDHTIQGENTTPYNSQSGVGLGDICLSDDGTKLVISDHSVTVGTESLQGICVYYELDANGKYKEVYNVVSPSVDGSDKFGESAKISGDGSVVVVGATGNERPSDSVATGTFYIFD